MKTRFRILMMIFTIASLSVGCEGEDGEDGMNGINGIDGIDGVQGPAGEDGNANVIASDWLDLSGDFISGLLVEVEVNSFEDSRITQELIDTYVILVYARSFNTTRVRPIPETFFNQVYTYSLSSFVNEFNFIGRHVDGFSDIVLDRFEAVRYVFIPSSNTSKSSKENALAELKNAGVDTSNYYEVMDYFGLEY